MPTRQQRHQRRFGSFVSMRTLADDLELSERTIRRWISAGQLPAYRLPGERSLRVRLEDVEALMHRVPTVDGDSGNK